MHNHKENDMIRTALVTGGTRGIGLEWAMPCARRALGSQPSIATMSMPRRQRLHKPAWQCFSGMSQTCGMHACMHGVAIMGIRDAGSPDRYTRITHAIQMRRQSWTTMLQSNEV